MNRVQKQKKSTLEFKERFDPGLISALYQNFKDPIQAILELVDNCVDDLIEGRKMYITVDTERDAICIVNKGGTGMGPKELDSFFAWGLSSKRGKLGRYGQGGKAAMGYLGKSWKIRSTRVNDNKEYIIEEKNWDDRAGGLKKYKPTIQKSQFPEEGVVQIDIRKLKKKINKNELRRTLSKVYRPLVEFERVEMYSNGKVAPQEIPLDMPKEYFGESLSNGEKIAGWISLLEKGSKLRGGVRCYIFGRLVTEREFFGQKDPTYKESLDRLIGELYIDSDNLPLLMNKSDVDRASTLWKEVEKIMFKKLDPYIKLLLEEKEKDIPTEKEKKVAEYAGKIWADFMKSLKREHYGGALPGLPYDYGQKQPEASRQPTLVDKKVNLEKERREPYDPATPPPPGAIGKRRRTLSYLKPVPKPLHASARYVEGKINGNKVIFINTRYPLYKIRKHQLPLYIWETLAFEYAKHDDFENQQAESYLGEVNSLLYELGVYIRKKKIKTPR